MSPRSRYWRDVVLMGAILMVISALASFFFVTATKKSAEERRYQECLEDIAPYLDAQEILYQEQECGWGVDVP